MGPLSNHRHEAFCRAVFENKSADEAYALAGYKPHRQNAHRLITKDDVQARLAELQAEAAKSSVVTVESLLAELELARSKAVGLDQLSAAVKASSEKAKIAGLHQQTINVNHRYHLIEEIDRAETAEGIALATAASYGVQLTEKQREEFQEILEGWHVAIRKFLEPLAKTIEVTPPQQHDIERKRLGLARGR